MDATFDKIKPILIRACRPIAAVWKELEQEVTLDSAEVEMGLSFEGEGNVYITKVKGTGNLTVKLILKSTASSQ